MADETWPITPFFMNQETALQNAMNASALAREMLEVYFKSGGSHKSRDAGGAKAWGKWIKGDGADANK